MAERLSEPLQAKRAAGRTSSAGKDKIKHGEMAERSKAIVLKTIVGQPTQGSNPCLSAMICTPKSGHGDVLPLHIVLTN